MHHPDAVQLTLPATREFLSVLGASITTMLDRAIDIPDRDIQAYNIQLAVHEICVNIVDHAYNGHPDGKIDVNIMLHPHRIEVELFDTGQSFDPNAVPEPNLVEGQVRGYGLFLVNQLMDTVIYQALPGKNRWLLVKNFHTGDHNGNRNHQP